MALLLALHEDMQLQTARAGWSKKVSTGVEKPVRLHVLVLQEEAFQAACWLRSHNGLLPFFSKKPVGCMFVDFNSLTGCMFLQKCMLVPSTKLFSSNFVLMLKAPDVLDCICNAIFFVPSHSL